MQELGSYTLACRETYAMDALSLTNHMTEIA